MPVEIERKFLVNLTHWTPLGNGKRLRQGYLSTEGATVRVRRDDERGWLTIKGAREGITRAEFEYEIPRVEADWMLDHLCRRPLIEKIRHTFAHEGHIWEVDVFENENAGLVVAEIELSSEKEPFTRPIWLGEEVSEDFRYTNQQLSERPYCHWNTPTPP